MVFEIVWTNIAIEDYQKIISYLLSNWNESTAAKFEGIINKKLVILTIHPYIGIPSKKEIGVRSILLTKYNKLFCRVKNNKIEVLAIFDTRQNPAKSPF